MKSIHSIPLAMTLAALGSTLLSSCSGCYRDPLDGQQKKWECGDDPTPEQARKKFHALEEHKGRIDTLLTVLRNSEPTATTQANIDLCLENLAQIAEGKAKLEPRMQ